MKKQIYTTLKALIFATIVLCFSGCATISQFDQYAYSQSTSLKVDVNNLMGMATDKFSSHQQEVTFLQTSVAKMLEYEKNRPKNDISEKMWTILNDPNGNLFGGFIARWQKEGTLDPDFIKEMQNLVAKSFDQISQLESGKIKASQITN